MWSIRASRKSARDIQGEPAEAKKPASCPSAGQDDVCTDEVEHTTNPRNSSELEGSVLEVGAGFAGLTPVELPENEEQARRRGTGESRSGDGCGSCR